MIVSDNGIEFTSNAVLKWASKNAVEWHYIIPGILSESGYGCSTGTSKHRKLGKAQFEMEKTSVAGQG